MAFDLKKEYKEFYMPKNKPDIVTVPCMNYIAVRGSGDPSQEDGEYKQAIGVLKACLAHYEIEWKPSVKYACTVQIGRKLLPDMKHNLNVMCDYYGIALDHHKADSDSHACAEILLRYFADGVNEKSIIRTYHLEEDTRT